MKNAQVKHIPLQLSSLETKVWNLVESSGSPRVIDIAKIIFRNTKRKPKSISYSVNSAIRQINLKLAKSGSKQRIVGKFNGRGGKQLYFEK